MSEHNWHCETCGCSGSSEICGVEGAWEGGQIVLALHRAVSPNCTGGADTIRITTRRGDGHQKPSKAVPPSKSKDDTSVAMDKEQP